MMLQVIKPSVFPALFAVLLTAAACQSGSGPDARNTETSSPAKDSGLSQAQQVTQAVSATDSPAVSAPVPPPPPPPKAQAYIIPEITAIEEKPVDETVEETVEAYNRFLNDQPQRAEPVEAMEPRVPVVEFAEQMPEFNYREQTVQQYLINNIRYPETARDEDRSGTVYLRFVVETDGKVSLIQIIKSSGYDDLDREATRVIRMMPAWKPGTQDGKPVRVSMKLPVRFTLQ